MSINQNTIDQCIALAGLAQSVRIVQHIAWKGSTNSTDFKAVIASILRTEAKSTAAIYHGSFEVSTGLRLLSHQLDTQHKDKDPEFINIAINVIALQAQLQKNKKLLNLLTTKIDALSNKYSTEDLYNNDELFEEVVEACSDAYKQTLSKLSNRIQVKGEPQFLKQKVNQNYVRAALLAAIRSTFLWRQLGGSRWHFLFNKKALLQTIKHLMANPIKE